MSSRRNPSRPRSVSPRSRLRRLKISRDFLLGDRSELVERIREEGLQFRARLKSDEAKNAFIAFMSRKKG